MKSIKKLELERKYVQFIDRRWQYRIGKVSKVKGNILTIKTYNPSKDKFAIKQRICMSSIIGRQLKNRIQPIEVR